MRSLGAIRFLFRDTSGKHPSAAAAFPPSLCSCDSTLTPSLNRSLPCSSLSSLRLSEAHCSVQGR